MLRPTNAGAATSALFEMKKGTAFLVRQDQQNDAQIFVILFWEKYRCQQEKSPLKKGAGWTHLHETGKRPVRIGADALKQRFASMVWEKKSGLEKARKRLMRLTFRQTHLYRFVNLVRVTGIEPAASWTPFKRDTKLRHTRICRFAELSLNKIAWCKK